MIDWVDNSEELVLLLNLTRVSGVGSSRLRALIARFNTPSEIIAENAAGLCSIDGIDRGIAEEIRQAKDNDFGQRQLEAMFKSHYRLVTFWNNEYPTILKRIYDPPINLFVWGQFLPKDAFSLAVVGTRTPTAYGKQVAAKIVGGLTKAGATIVSGLARGIDTLAHAETVKCSGRTIAVLGSGVDVIYPAENAKLASHIVENGAVISEYPLGTKPDAINFPRRNRIISGLSLGTVVIEARKTSGALITANFALEQNREVFAVPGSIFSPQSEGPLDLVKQGAKLVCDVEDILEELPPQGELFTSQDFTATMPKDVSPEQKKILDKLRDTPAHIDTLARDLETSPAQLLSLLLQLEFQGYVKQLPGKMFVIG